MRCRLLSRIVACCFVLFFFLLASFLPAETRISIEGSRWLINGTRTSLGSPAEGLLMNVRMVNALFEDTLRPEFNPEENADEFILKIPEYVSHGIRAFTVSLQGGFPGYEQAINSAFNPDGSLKDTYLKRTCRVIEAADRAGAAVILSCYYQRQDQILQDEDALRAGVVNVARWIGESNFTNVLLEIANEMGHGGFNHPLLKEGSRHVELIRLARETNPNLLIATSGLGDGSTTDLLAEASDFLLIHFNTTPLKSIPSRIEALRKYGKPIVCNEDDKIGTEGAQAARLCVQEGISWGLMAEKTNQHFPFHFNGTADDPLVYAELKRLTSSATPASSPQTYFPPPESAGGWRKLDNSDDIRRLAGMAPDKLADLKEWLLKSDDRDFAAVVIRNGYIVLEVERGNSAKTDARRVASVSKAICATVLSIASEQSQLGKTPRKMSFEDPAFDFIPWAEPVSDPRKAKITIKQLFNHTSGLCPEAVGAQNDGSWDYVLGHSGDKRTEQLAFDPGQGCGYSTHGLAHASLVCENVTGKPYDQFAVEALFKPIGCEHWWFQFYDGSEKIGRHPSHGMGMPARDLARIAYCMAHDGRWEDKQIIPRWFVEQTAQPTSNVQSREMRWGFNPDLYSHGWELPARLDGKNKDGISGDGIPADARYKPGSGGQLIAFVPSLDLVITRQTGSSGNWQYAEYLRHAVAATLAK